MAVTWERFAEEAPELAALVRRRLEAHGLALLATLRRDGSPRISGIEPAIGYGQLWLGMMPGSRKSADLRRDPRFALHNATIDKDVAEGDVKLSGRAQLVEAREDFARFSELHGHPWDPGGATLYQGRLTEAATVEVVGDRLVVRSWRPGQGVRTVERT